MKQNLAIGIAIIAILLSGFGLIGGNKDHQSNLGAIVGGVTNFDNIVLGGVIATGNMNSTSTPGSTTLTSTDLSGYSDLSVTITGSSATNITLPASSTLSSFLSQAGQTRDWVIINASTTGPTLTLVGGTGTIVKSASSTASLQSGSVGFVRIVRKANSDLVFSIVPTN